MTSLTEGDPCVRDDLVCVGEEELVRGEVALGVAGPGRLWWTTRREKETEISQ